MPPPKGNDAVETTRDLLDLLEEFSDIPKAKDLMDILDDPNFRVSFYVFGYLCTCKQELLLDLIRGINLELYGSVASPLICLCKG